MKRQTDITELINAIPECINIAIENSGRPRLGLSNAPLQIRTAWSCHRSLVASSLRRDVSSRFFCAKSESRVCVLIPEGLNRTSNVCHTRRYQSISKGSGNKCLDFAVIKCAINVSLRLGFYFAGIGDAESDTRETSNLVSLLCITYRSPQGRCVSLRHVTQRSRRRARANV